MPLQISNTRPPVWERIKAAGMDFDENNTVFTYGDTIFNPSGKHIHNDILAHEGVHVQQQLETEGGPEGWWEKYLADPAFRLQEEAAAYAIQLYLFCERHKNNRNRKAQMLVHMATVMAGEGYGKMVTIEEAKALLLKHSEITL